MRAVFLSLAVLLVAGCDGVTDDAFTPQLVVSATIGAGEPLPTVRLTRTTPFLEAYDPDGNGVAGAEVEVVRVGVGGAPDVRYAYTAGTRAGEYLPPATEARGVAGATYRLRIAVEGGVLTAETTVPPALALAEPPAERVVYGEGQGPEVRVTRSSTPGRQAAFVGSTRALDPSDYVEVEVDGETRFRSVPGTGFLPTPIYQRFLDCEPEAGGTILCGEDPLGENVVIGTSPVINEASYIDLGDGTILVQVPFLAFGYYGPSQLTLVSLDPALQVFVQTQAVQNGGTTLSPGEIPNATSNVTGGLGLFGSYARVMVRTEIVEPGG